MQLILEAVFYAVRAGINTAERLCSLLLLTHSALGIYGLAVAMHDRSGKIDKQAPYTTDGAVSVSTVQ